MWNVQEHKAYIDDCGDAAMCVAAIPGVSAAAHDVGAEATMAADEEGPAASTTTQAAATAAEASVLPQDAETLLAADVTADDGFAPAPTPGQANGAASGQAGVGRLGAQACRNCFYNT